MKDGTQKPGLLKRLEKELADFDKSPHPPQKGTVNVMPQVYLEAEKVRLQFNGWAIDLWSGGLWVLCDTASEAASQTVAPKRKTP